MYINLYHYLIFNVIGNKLLIQTNKCQGKMLGKRIDIWCHEWQPQWTEINFFHGKLGNILIKLSNESYLKLV